MIGRFRRFHVLFTTSNHRLDMKKILASVVAVAAVTGFASVAHAAGTSSPTTVGTASAPVTSVHTGTVPVQCTIAVTDGTLAQTAANSNIIDSSALPGLITTKCNTSTSKLDLSLGAVVEPGNTPADYTQAYKLEGGTNAYAAAGSGVYTIAAGTYTSAANTVTNLSHGFVNADSTVQVVAKGEVPTTKQLAAGTYTITVNATITP